MRRDSMHHYPEAFINNLRPVFPLKNDRDLMLSLINLALKYTKYMRTHQNELFKKLCIIEKFAAIEQGATILKLASETVGTNESSNAEKVSVWGAVQKKGIIDVFRSIRKLAVKISDKDLSVGLFWSAINKVIPNPPPRGRSHGSQRGL